MADPQRPTRAQMLADLGGAQAAPAPTARPSREQMLADLTGTQAPAAQAPQTPSTLDQIGSSLQAMGHSAIAGVHGAANFLTANYLPNIEGGLAAPGMTANDLASGGADLDEIGDSLKKNYISARDSARGYEDQLEKDAPYAYNAGGLASGFINPLGELGSAEKGAGLLGRLEAAGTMGATYGEITNPGDTKGEIGGLQAQQRARNAGFGTAIGVGAQGLIGEPIRGAKKLMSTFLGPSEEAIDKYLANPDLIKTAPDVPTMKNMVDAQVSGIQQKVQAGEMSVSQAQQHLSLLNDNLQQISRDSGKEYQQAIPQLRESVGNAHDALGALDQQISSVGKQAGTEFQQSLPELRGQTGAAQDELSAQRGSVEQQLGAVPHPRVMADDVHQAVGDLKQQVVTEAGKARQIAANSGLAVQTQPVAQALQDAIDKMKINGKLPATAQGKQTVAQLQDLMKGITDYGPSLSGEDAKRLIQQLDQAVEYGSEAGGFGEAHDSAIKDARRAVDGQLKSFQPYADQMSTVADKTGLLEKANKLFGTRERAYSQMNGIANAGKTPQQDILSQLGAHTGRDFSTPVQNYQTAQSTLKNGMDAITQKLPAQAKVRDAALINEIAPYLKDTHVQNAISESGLPAQRPALEENANAGDLIQDMAPHLKDAYVNAQINESGVPQKISAHEAELQRLQEQLQGMQQTAEPYNKWGPQATQTKLQGLVSKSPDRASIEAGRELEGLDKIRGPYEGPSYPEMIDANRVRNQFTRSNLTGARNSYIWSKLGAVSGAGAGLLFPGAMHYPVVLGSGAGAGIGGYIDKNGGEMAQGILNHYLANKSAYDALQKVNIQKATAPWVVMSSKGGAQ